MVGIESLVSTGRVILAVYVAKERFETHPRVSAPCVVRKGSVSNGDVEAAGDILEKGVSPHRCVASAADVIKQGLITKHCVGRYRWWCDRALERRWPCPRHQ
jgi:hypothetical protein